MIELQLYSTLRNWSSVSMELKKEAIEVVHSAIPLSELLVRVMEPVVIQDDEEYTRLTVKTGGAGAIVRQKAGKPEVIRGKDIGRKNQFKVHSGQMVVSSIDARNGAAGIVPEEADGCVVTDNFWVFRVNEQKVIPAFLQLLLARPSVTSQIKGISHGTTNRQYITIDQFLKVSVVIPAKIEQKKFICHFEKLQAKKRKLQKEIDAFGSQRESMISKRLGITAKQTESDAGRFFVVEYQDLYKWSSGGSNNRVSSCPKIRMEDCIAEFMSKDAKSLRVYPQATPTKKYFYVGMDGVEKNLGLLSEKPKTVKGIEIKSSSISVPTGYIIFGKLRPYLNKFWLNKEKKENIICSSEFLVFRPSERIDINYFITMLGAEIVQDQIGDKQMGTRMPRLSATDFLDLEIPATNLVVQKEIGEDFLRLQEDVDKKRRQLKRLVGLQTEKLYTKYGL